MARQGLAAAIVAAALSTVPAAAGAPDAPSDFQRIASLVGEWHGPFEWSGARTDKGEMSATYSATGHGTAIVENLVSGGEVIMTSVYHMDGPTLRMTHFCGAGNQPRLKVEAEPPAADPNTIAFAFVDATNLGDPPRPHVDRVEIRFLDADHFRLTFRFTGPKGSSLEHISLARVSPPARQSG